MALKKHGYFGTPTYGAWSSMHDRCRNPKNASFARYGGRGIRVCERWSKFENFLADMGEKPEGLSLDRHPDGSGDYGPGNCRWATATEQARNRRSSLFITHEGETKTAAEWAEQFGLHRCVVATRFRAGWDTNRIFTEPVKAQSLRSF